MRSHSRTQSVFLLGNVVLLAVLYATVSWAEVPGNKPVEDVLTIPEELHLEAAFAGKPSVTQVGFPSIDKESAGFLIEDLKLADVAGTNVGLAAALTEQGDSQQSATLVAVSLHSSGVTSGGVGRDRTNLFLDSKNSEFPLSVVIAVIALVSLVSIARRR
jgi:hypothetical protein